MPFETDPRVFVLLHGWKNYRGEGHWQRWLAEQLLTRGRLVVYPQLPEAEHPRLELWLATVSELLAPLAGARVTVVCHSLACLLWLRLSRLGRVPAFVDRVVLVAVPSPVALVGTDVQHFDDGSRRIGPAEGLRVIASDDDPYCPEGVAVAYEIDASVPLDVVHESGHFTPDSGFGAWPGLLEMIDPAEEGVPGRG